MAVNQKIEFDALENEETIFLFSKEELVAQWQLMNYENDQCVCQANPISPISIPDNNQNDLNIYNSTNPVTSVKANSQSTLFDPVNAVQVTKKILPYGLFIYDDVPDIIKICNELGFKGRIIDKKVNGKLYIIIKGFPGKRNILTGTKYLASNTKIVKMALGSIELKKRIKSGGMLTFALTVSLDILEAVLDDESTMESLIGTIASDLIKIGIGSIIAGAAGLGVGAVTTIACGPLVVAIGVGFAVGWALDSIDDHYNLTDKLIQALEDFSADLSEKYESIEHDLSRQMHEFERQIIYKATRGFDIDNPFKEW